MYHRLSAINKLYAQYHSAGYYNVDFKGSFNLRVLLDHPKNVSEQFVTKYSAGQSSEYDKFKSVVTQLNYLQKRMPTPEVAQNYLLKAYRFEKVLMNFLLILACINIILSAAVYGMMTLVTLRVDYLVVTYNITVTIYAISIIPFVIKYILLYLSHTMDSLENYSRISYIILVAVNIVPALYYRPVVIKFLLYSRDIDIVLTLVASYCVMTGFSYHMPYVFTKFGEYDQAEQAYLYSLSKTRRFIHYTIITVLLCSQYALQCFSAWMTYANGEMLYRRLQSSTPPSTDTL
jgi:hypothetical protein